MHGTLLEILWARNLISGGVGKPVAYFFRSIRPSPVQVEQKKGANLQIERARGLFKLGGEDNMRTAGRVLCKVVDMPKLQELGVSDAHCLRLLASNEPKKSEERRDLVEKANAAARRDGITLPASRAGLLAEIFEII
ncbi:hypothetical protein ACFL5U_03660 [Candidatus Margulisiibacteriota bacterium]